MAYVKEVFDVSTFEHAKNVVLTNDPNDPFKFDNETNYFIEKIKNENLIHENSMVLDFGCGIGRVSKKLIEKFNCNVIGVDISDSMLFYSKLHVASLKKYTPQKEYKIKDSIDVALSVFVLQHVEDPISEIENLYEVVKPDGYFILLNENKRYVPSGVDENNFVIWNDDNFNIFKEIEMKFKYIKEIPYMNTDKHIIIYQK
jgi:2-polyprenyl-3-methyl-5-hydroxy-6-metoxy-1,4-benzoquinol methylase